MNEYILAGIIGFLLVYLAWSEYRHARQVDVLTSKIMAPSFSDYVQSIPETTRKVDLNKTPKPNNLPSSNLVAIDNADMESVLRSMAQKAGQEADYERYEP